MRCSECTNTPCARVFLRNTLQQTLFKPRPCIEMKQAFTLHTINEENQQILALGIAKEHR